MANGSTDIVYSPLVPITFPWSGPPVSAQATSANAAVPLVVGALPPSSPAGAIASSGPTGVITSPVGLVAATGQGPFISARS